MSTIRLLALVLANLPDIIKLVEHLEKRVKAGAQNADLQIDIKAINKAFEDKDPEALNRIFNS